MAAMLDEATWNPYRYTRNEIHSTAKYNIILMCWSEGNATSIHDHTGSECIMKCVAGNIRESRFKWPERRKTKLEVISTIDAVDGDVVSINDEEGLHRIENLSDCEKAMSLHFYYPPITECLIFDEETGKARRVSLKHSHAGN